MLVTPIEPRVRPDEAAAPGRGTFTGNRGLAIEEPLIFEIGRTDTTGVDLEEPAQVAPRLGKLERTEPIGLPGLRGKQPEVIAIAVLAQLLLLRDHA